MAVRPGASALIGLLKSADQTEFSALIRPPEMVTLCATDCSYSALRRWSGMPEAQ